MAAKRLPTQFPVLIARQFNNFRDGSLRLSELARSAEEQKKILIDVVNNHATLLDGLQLPVKTDATRGAAGTAGLVIFNSDDGQLNIDDGSNWTLPDGTTT